MAKLHSLKEKQECYSKEHKSNERVLLDNIKASIDPIIPSESGKISKGAKLRWLQEEIIITACPQSI